MTTEIRERIWPTVALVGTAAVLSAVIGITIGIFAAWRRGSAFDQASTSTTMLLYSMPDFWLGLLLLVLFASIFEWFPTGGFTDAGSTRPASPDCWTRPTTWSCPA